MTVNLSGVPWEYTHATLLELHDAFQLDANAFLTSDFPEHAGDEASCTVKLRYSSEEVAEQAVEALDGQPVATRSGDTLYLSAELVRKRKAPPAPPPMMVRSSGRSSGDGPPSDGWRNNNSGGGDWYGGGGGSGDRGRGRSRSRERYQYGYDRRDDRYGSPDRYYGYANNRRSSYDDKGGKGNFGKGFGKGFEKGGKGGKGNRPRGDGGGPTVIYPSVYVSDVPVEYNEDTVKQLHDVLGLDANKLMGVKFLPSKDSSGQTGSAIFRYCDQDAADKAVQGIRGQPVQLGNGACKFLGARLAKAASWMVERGIQDPVDNGGTSLRDGPRDAPQKPKEKTAAPALPKAPGAGGAEAEWPGDGTDAVDTSGMPVYQEEMPEEQWDGTEIREAGAL